MGLGSDLFVYGDFVGFLGGCLGWVFLGGVGVGEWGGDWLGSGGV